jgi:hypothetical protein
MNTYSTNGPDFLEPFEVKATALHFGGNFMEVQLEDGRMLRIPLDWFPRLQRATESQRKKFKWLDDHRAMHWPSVDEDISIHSLLKGVRAPNSKAYLEGPSDESRRRRAEIEAEYKTKRAPIRTPRKKVSKAKH